MTEYDYSEEGRRRYMATQQRIGKWVQGTASAPSLKNPFMPHTVVPTARPSQHGSASPSRAPTQSTHYSRGPSTHHTARPPGAPSYQPTSPSTLRSMSMAPPPSPSSHSRPAPTVYPSDSISQAGSQRPSHLSGSSHHTSSTHHSRHTHHHHHHRPPTYIVSPPPSPAGRSGGVIILPRHGKPPQVVFY